MPKDQRKELAKMLKKANLPNLIKIVDDLSDDLREIVLDTISQEVTDVRKTQALSLTTARVREADVDVRVWLTDGAAVAYIDGMLATDRMLGEFGIKTKAGKITVETLKGVDELKPHLQAVNGLISESYNDFANGMNGIIRGTERMFNEATRRQVRAKIAEGRLTGASIREITKEVKNIIGTQGFSVLLDRGGRQWSLKTYSEMLARTHLIKANNEAIINRAVEFEIDIVEVSTHGATDKICEPLEGKLFSLSGKSKNYPKLELDIPFHPNCKHRWLLRPDLS